jgi:rhodanese-related sulfurtransferase
MGGGDIRGGTVESHPQTVSSNGATLPENKEEVIKLYHDVPDQYKKYVQLGIFENNDISKSNDKNVGRYAPQDRNTEQKTEQALNQLTINKQKHVVVVNSGGPHSIAAARALAKKGYLILVHFNHLKGDAFIQDTGALLYFAKEIADLNRATVKNNPQAPWALILDAHQNTSASDESVHSKPILEDRDLPPIPNGYGIIEITEGHHSLHDQSATKEKLVWDSLRIAKERGVKGIYNLGLDPYKSSMP